eukprot:TRINITY_DN49329_c0_g1_i1.p1 TRINITY_DN49329_c0_g1~~TRINITY_DN49329_c0_g1_i1.p1  ORF type:complete len:268 (+),score=47.27 TRINITY_DN49329_c0_g1_i1:31-834(+)
MAGFRSNDLALVLQDRQILLVAAASAVLGFAAGMYLAAMRRSPRVKRKLQRQAQHQMAGIDLERDGNGMQGMVCECGAIIPGTCTPEEIARHKASNRHKRNMLRHSANEVVVCEEVSEYRAAALALVKSTDLVLEIGSHVGGTTKFIAGVAGRVVGLDQQPLLVAEARKKYPEIQFENFDAFDTSKLLDLVKSVQPDRFSKVFIDISGSRELSTVFRLLDLIDHLIKPDLTVVKSQPFKKLLLRGQLWIHHPEGPNGQLCIQSSRGQ